MPREKATRPRDDVVKIVSTGRPVEGLPLVEIANREDAGGDMGAGPGLKRAPNGRALAVGLATVAAATLLAIGGDSVPPSVAALAYVLAVTVAAARAGLWAGLVASLLAFLGLNFFFTPPHYTFTVERTEDLVALFVFLAVSGIVGTLLSTALRQRARAEQREREARLLHHVATRLLSGEPVAAVLRRFAEAVAELLDLARCEVTTDLTTETIVIAREQPEDGPSEIFVMATADREVGRIVVQPSREHGLGDGEREVIHTFAGQMALALERLHLAAEARHAHIDAEESRLRAALFSSVTHDLRTPLASITAAVTSLEDPGASFTPQDRTELLDTIHHEADRLNRLVGNLLDLARMRAGAITPSKVPTDIEEVIEGVLARLQSLFDGRTIHLKLRDDLPPIPMDVLQIDQVLTNLLENAAKFSPSGAEITITAVPWQERLEVRVIDRGSSIPPEERERVFEPFTRADDHPNAGTGLGLSIAQAIVVAHGGRMWIEATPGGGTTVAFTLPDRA